jgi:hypothetical protein
VIPTRDTPAVLLDFIEKINRHDIGGLTALMTDDHEFVDSLGMAVRGKDAMRQAWIGYFYLIPDYAIAVDDVFAKDDSAALVGTASGTCAERGKLLPENRWSIPIAIRCTVRDGFVARWQVFADNEPVRRLMKTGA